MNTSLHEEYRSEKGIASWWGKDGAWHIALPCPDPNEEGLKTGGFRWTEQMFATREEAVAAIEGQNPQEQANAALLTRYPFPWRRYNARIIDANGVTLSGGIPMTGSGALKEITAGAITDGIADMLARGDFILTACTANPHDVVARMGKRSHLERRNKHLEEKQAKMIKAFTALVAHCDSIIAAEGSEFNAGAFDSMKDTLHDARELLPKVEARA